MTAVRSAAPQRWVGERLATAPGPLVLVAVALTYLVLAQAAMAVHAAADRVTLWPAAGLALAALLMLPPARWGWVLGAVALAQLGGDLAWGVSVGAALGWTVAHTAEPLVGALLLQRRTDSADVFAPKPRLLSFLLAGTLVAPVTGATLASAVSRISGESPFVEAWPDWFSGHATGVLLAAPVLLAGGVLVRCGRRDAGAEADPDGLLG